MRRLDVLLPIAALVAIWLLPVLPSRALAQEPVQSRQTILFNTAHPSIVFLQAKADEGTDFSFCTGSIVASDDSASTIMTAAHCVTGNHDFKAFLNDDVSVSHPATVIKSGTTDGDDVAFLRIDVGHLPVLRLATRVDVGANVLIIGYPRAALLDFRQRHVLVARLDQTAIASVVPRANGLPQTINYQYAVTDHGDSGAPLIEIECGCIVGVVHAERDDAQGRSDYAMGPQEIWDLASADAPQIALTRAAGFAPDPAPSVPVADVAPAAPGLALSPGYAPPPPPAPGPVVMAPPAPGALPVEPLLTVSAPDAVPQWTGWKAAVQLTAVPGLYVQVRCIAIGRQHLWQVQASNQAQQKVVFAFRLTKTDGSALDGPKRTTLDNDGSYIFLPQELPSACDEHVALPVSDVSFTGDPKAPQPENLNATDGGPQIVYNPWSDWKVWSFLSGGQFASRCIEFGGGWFGWQVAFQNGSGHAVTFDFDIEPQGSEAEYRHRYLLPATAGVPFYTDVIPLRNPAACNKDQVTIWSRS